MKLITHHTQAGSAQLHVDVVIFKKRHFNPMCLWLLLQETLQCASCHACLTEVLK